MQFVSKHSGLKRLKQSSLNSSSLKMAGVILAAIGVIFGCGFARTRVDVQANSKQDSKQGGVASQAHVAGALQALKKPQWANGPQVASPIQPQPVPTQQPRTKPKSEPIAQAPPDRKLGQRLEAAYQASWYGPGFHGNLTANGEIFDQQAMTAAHKELPFGTELRVTNVANGQSVVVRVNDRGPYIEGRELDLSAGAAAAIGGTAMGVIPIQMEILSPLNP